MKIYYVYDNDMDCTGDTLISLHLTKESAEAKIKTLMNDYHPKYKDASSDYYEWNATEVEE